MFELTKISKVYGADAVLKACSLSVAPGEVLGLLGPSGAGKSTLLQCANLLVIPDQGELVLGAETIEFKNDKKRSVKSKAQLLKWRQKIAMVFQQFNLWQHKTVLENITLAPLQVLKQNAVEAEKKAKALLAQVGLSAKADKYPKFLSGGQQQRVAIARALAMDPKVILFDEPTASLDPESSQDVLELIKALANDGKTLLIATHEIEFAKSVVDKVIFMEKGEIVAKGTRAEMFEENLSERFKKFIGS